jgi:hypothetical protein
MKKVMRNCHSRAQKLSKNDFTEATGFTELISEKVAYKRTKEKISEKRFSAFSSFSNLTIKKP